MKSNFIKIIIIYFFFHSYSFGENLKIESSTISIDKNTKVSIFKDNVVARDTNNNTVKTNYAEYQKDLGIFKSIGETTILTSEGFFIKGKDILFQNKINLIKSEKEAVLTDLEGNKIYLNNFEYSTKEKFFKSIGKVKVLDKNSNTYNFTQLYIDEKKREIIGTDIKAFLNDESFKVNSNNKPRVFANTLVMKNEKTEFNKSVFTLCDYRKNDKCPPWLFQASKMSHDKLKKTVYYDNALIKFYDIPIFYFPKFSHPDPSVNRRSGFLPPSFTDTKNLGAGFEVPYFLTLGMDKDITFSAKMFDSVHPLFLTEYRQAFDQSNLIVDTGYTKGYKTSTTTKKKGDKSHFFSQFVKNFKGKNGSVNNLQVKLQDTSHDKYLKLYKIDSDLVNYETDYLENSVNFTREDEDSFLGLQISSFENLKENYDDKYEFIFPDLVYDTNLFSNDKIGNIDYRSNIIIKNYDTDKLTKFFVNDFDWKFKDFYYPSGIKGQILGKIRNVNYEAKNESEYKDEKTSELFGALGYLTSVDLFKNTINNAEHLLSPKLLLRYAPGHMRKHTNDLTRLDTLNLFDIHRIDQNHNFENGLSATVGFDYEMRGSKSELFNLSLGQVINDKENQHMPSSSGLDEKMSDVVGKATYQFKVKDNFDYKLDYSFKVDQNYEDLNYNELSSTINFDPLKFNVNYLQAKKHLGNKEFVETDIEYQNNQNGLIAFRNKRNLIKNSWEYYDLSYEYLNDCLRAGIVYRREFYNDSELEPENSLMFKITLTPFANINTPLFNQ